MTKEDLIQNINNLPDELFQAVIDFVTKFDNTIEFDGDKYLYEDVNIEDFYNEKDND